MALGTEAVFRTKVIKETEGRRAELSRSEALELFDSAARHLYDDARAVDPVISAQVATGEFEVTFCVRHPAESPEARALVQAIISDMTEAVLGRPVEVPMAAYQTPTARPVAPCTYRLSPSDPKPVLTPA